MSVLRDRRDPAVGFWVVECGRKSRKILILDGRIEPVSMTTHMVGFHSAQEMSVLRGGRDPAEGSGGVG